MQCAIRFVHANAEKYNIDTKRIFLIGQSAGGHMVSLAATLGDGPFRRTGGWEMRRMALGGLKLAPATAAQRRSAGIGENKMAVALPRAQVFSLLVTLDFLPQMLMVIMITGT